MRLKPRHVIGVALLGTGAFIAASRLTNDPMTLMGVGTACLCCLQAVMGAHTSGLRKELLERKKRRGTATHCGAN